MSVKEKIVEYLKDNHVGADNAVLGNRLCTVFGIKSVLLRKIINELRIDNHAVCSDSNGYFYAGCSEEIDSTISHLDSRSREMQRAKDGLLQSKETFNVEGDDNEQKT